MCESACICERLCIRANFVKLANRVIEHKSTRRVRVWLLLFVCGGLFFVAGVPWVSGKTSATLSSRDHEPDRDFTPLSHTRTASGLPDSRDQKAARHCPERTCRRRPNRCVSLLDRARCYPSALPAIPCFSGAGACPGASIARTSRAPLHSPDCCVPAAAPTAAACCCRSPCANKNSGVARRHPVEGGGVWKPSLARVLLSSEHEVASFHAGHQKSLLVAT